MKVYNKLVRDKIPQIIENNGRKAVYRYLNDKIEYLNELEKKLNEELKEYEDSKSLEEMADILEVLFSICIARGYSVEELLKMREEKAMIRGSFKEKIFLERVDD